MDPKKPEKPDRFNDDCFENATIIPADDDSESSQDEDDDSNSN